MLLFLDIDGVMVPGSAWKQPEFLHDGFPAFSSKATAALKHILAETGADIILTSSHKSAYTLEKWKLMFQVRGIPIDNISRLEDNSELLSRKDEILKWFSKNRISDFLIVDDDKSLNALPEYLKNNFVQTSATVGLTFDLAEEALRMLNINCTFKPE